MHVEGKTSITNQPISQTFFIETTASAEYATEIVDEYLALQNIQANKDDNDRYLDKIEVDRERVKRRTSRTAERRAEAGEVAYVLKQKQLEALENVQSMFPDTPLRPFFENNIRDARTKRSFEAIVRKINNDIKTTGSVNATTISKFAKMLREVKIHEREHTTVESVVSVLNYARRSN